MGTLNRLQKEVSILQLHQSYSMETNGRASLEIDKEAFRKMGHQLIDDIADFIESIESKPVTPNESPHQIQQLIPISRIPENGTSATELIAETTELLMNHSLFNGHPKFLGYITSSPAPIGALADLLAATINPNVGAYILSPVATEIEKQTIKWLAEFIGLSPEYGGILVSGGNMANFTAFMAGINSKFPANFKANGISSSAQKCMIYCSKSTHTWIDKAAVLFGLGNESVQWIQTNADNKMDVIELEKTILADLKNNRKPIMVIGTAGDVSTGAVDSLSEISKICKKFNLWFHIDGAYGAPAAIIPELKALFEGMEEADSIALDPHKWLYSPLEAGCTLVKNPNSLTDLFSSHPEYYNFGKNEEENLQNFYEYGFQNSRGFRALKVWLGLRQIGRGGYEKLIKEDIELASWLFELADKHQEFEAVSTNLSITTLRYVPLADAFEIDYLNKLNEAILNDLQRGGEAFLSNAIVNGKYCLRACFVNFRTSRKDVEEIFEIILRIGKKIQNDLQINRN